MPDEISAISASDFFNTEVCKYAAYDTLRSITSYVDGLKVSQRKAIWVVLNGGYTKRVKVSQLASDVAKATNYIHGEGSMQVVITNLAKSYIGTNNYTLFLPDGNFGKRFNNKAGAPRYIFVIRNPSMDVLFNKNDKDILEEQYFEGDKIEPKFLLPAIPIFLINGVDGVGTGYKQVVLPRNPKTLIKCINAILDGKGESLNGKRIVPWFKGYKGTIRAADKERSSWEIFGNIYYEDNTHLVIDEIPMNYQLVEYKDVLDALKESKEIRDYEDMSDGDSFYFRIHVRSDFPKLGFEELCAKFKLVMRITEIFACIDENNRIEDSFNSEIDVLKAFVNVKLQYIEKRKVHMLKQYFREITILKNKLNFIKAIHDKSVNIMGTTEVVCARLEELRFDKVDDSYSYLLDMKIHTLTKDKYAELAKKLKDMIAEYKELKASTAIDLYKKDLDALSSIFD